VAATPVRAARILRPDTIIQTDGAGRLLARSPHPLGPYPTTLTERLDYWARHTPDQTFLAERDGAGHWRRLTYGRAHHQVRCIGEALVRRRLSAERPIVILSGNGLEHALLALAAMYVGVPYAPIAPSYSLLSRDYGTLGAIWAAMNPGLVFVADGTAFERALTSLPSRDVELVTCTPSSTAQRHTAFDALLAEAPTPSVDDAHARVGPDTVAKILFTSGSTGSPKGVINTQRMLSANQEQLRAVLTFLADEPPVLCDWLPWNHTFGGNHNFGLTLYNGGSLYIDAGTPTPAGLAATTANLREIATTAYFNVPRGYELLLVSLKADDDFRRVFFSRLKMLFYAAAGLRQAVSDDIDALALETCGERIPWVTGLGATESAPLAMCTGAMSVPVAGRVGVPVPGVELKAAPVGDVFEARVKGPNITPGYWRDPELTRASFDEDGYFCMGDAIALVDPADPARGFSFQGRLTEDFKLSTGTWVRVGPLRAALLAQFGTLAQDVVIAGHDRDAVAVLIFPNRHAGPPDPARFSTALAAFNEARAGSSTRVERAILLDQAPSIDAQEITDKGSINQKAVLRHRSALVEQLYGAPGPGLLIDTSPRSAHT
jgi:feruloyl-CoA synthase